MKFCTRIWRIFSECRIRVLIIFTGSVNLILLSSLVLYQTNKGNTDKRKIDLRPAVHKTDRPTYVIAPHYKNGSPILQKDVTQYWNQPLKKWKSEEEILTFIHIGKAGGTSMDTALWQSMLVEKRCNMSCVGSLQRLHSINCSNVKPIICGRHFDWTFVSAAEKEGYHMAPIILLREPVQRALSHINFGRWLPWTQGLKIRQQNLSEYLNDYESMLSTHEMWYDGQVSFR